MADTAARYNPFGRRASYGRKAIIAYRTLTPISWLLVVVIGIFYSIPHSRTGLPADHNPSPFSQTKTITALYWVILLLSQIGYIGQLWSGNGENLVAAANVAPYFILNNLFVLAFILLWVHEKFWGGEIIQIASLFTQATVYWKHPGLPQIIHLPAVAAPYAWSITALFWNGAIAVGGESFARRIVANVFIWVMYVWGQSHIVHRNDQSFGYSLSLLSLSLALKQFSIKIISLQWIFAFVIFALFTVTTFYSSTTRYHKRDFYCRRLAEPETTDREREPLLSNE